MSRIATEEAVAEFRDRLCAAGGELFAEKGFEGFTMRELAGRLGISAMTPYRYFAGKDALMSEMRGRAFQRFADWLEIHLEGAQADQTALAHAFAQYAIKEPSQYRLMFVPVQPIPAISPLHAAQESRVRTMVADYLRAQLSRNRSSGDPERLGIMFWSVLHGAGALYMAGTLSALEFAHALCDVVLLFTGGSAKTSYGSVNA